MENGPATLVRDTNMYAHDVPDQTRLRCGSLRSQTRAFPLLALDALTALLDLT